MSLDSAAGASSPLTSVPQASVGGRSLVLLAFVTFISLGLPDTLLGVAWPSVRGTYGRELGDIAQLLGTSAIAYLISSFSGGSMVKAFGVGPLLIGSSALITGGMAITGFSPAWAGMVIAAALGGLGAGAIDAGVNVFAAQRFSPRVVNWLHGCWGIGATIAPAVMTLCITQGYGWRVGYLLVGAVMLGMCGVFMYTRRMWTLPAEATSGEPVEHAGVMEALARPRVWVGILFYFVYAGVEVAAGAWLFTLLTQMRGMTDLRAGLIVSLYWGSLTAGRFVWGQLTAKVGALGAIRWGLGIGAAGAALMAVGAVTEVGVLRHAGAAVGAVLLGFGIAPAFPTMISLTPERVGERYSAQAVGFQVAGAALGIATLPGVVGWIARKGSLEVLGPWLVAGCLALLVLQEVSRVSAPRGK